MNLKTEACLIKSIYLDALFPDQSTHPNRCLKIVKVCLMKRSMSPLGLKISHIKTPKRGLLWRYSG